jgi:hypothetical protein
MVVVGATRASEEPFKVEDLYELQRRQGKLKPPVISREQRNSLKQKLGRQEGLNCSFIRSLQLMFRDFSTISGWLLWSPFTCFDSGLGVMRYTLFGSSRVDNIVSGRNRFARLRPSYKKDVRDVLERNYTYDPYRQSRS